MIRPGIRSNDEAIPGYHGRYLRVDLSTREVRTVPLCAGVLRRFIGGAGLGTWILLQETKGRPDPLSPEAPLVFVFSPVVGSPLTTSARFAVLAKEMAEMLALVTGGNVDAAELRGTAERIVTARKWYNIRQGSVEDTLPRRFFTEELAGGTSRGAILSEALIAAYNQAREWTPEGWIERRLAELGITE